MCRIINKYSKYYYIIYSEWNGCLQSLPGLTPPSLFSAIYFLFAQQRRLSEGDKENLLNDEHAVGIYLRPSVKHCDCLQGKSSIRQQAQATVFFITPTYVRHTQLRDLTVLCQTLQLAGHVVWIVVEDAVEKTAGVTRLLSRCHVHSVHLSVPTPEGMKPGWWEVFPKHRGIAQRNAGTW